MLFQIFPRQPFAGLEHRAGTPPGLANGPGPNPRRQVLNVQDDCLLHVSDYIHIRLYWSLDCVILNFTPLNFPLLGGGHYVEKDWCDWF
jgi:hypothetical protein